MGGALSIHVNHSESPTICHIPEPIFLQKRPINECVSSITNTSEFQGPTISYSVTTLRGEFVENLAESSKRDVSIKVPTDKDIKNIKASWEIIIGPLPSEDYITAQCTNKRSNFECFMDMFSEEFACICRDSDVLFQEYNQYSSDPFVIDLIDCCLRCLDEEGKADIASMAKRLKKDGISFLILHVMTEVLYHSLLKLLGNKYDVRVALAWSRVFTYVLSIMV